MPDDTNSVPLTTLTAPQQGTSMAENNYNTANPSDNLTPTPQSQPQGQPAQPQPSPQQAAQQTGNARHAALGKVTSFLLGKQYDYQVDPNTGKTVAVPIKQEPGQMFRSILAGAILGGAAAKGQTDITTGFLSGGEAAIKDQRAQDQQRLSRAQEQFKQQQQAAANTRAEREANRADEELKERQLMNKAQVAQWTAQNLEHEQDAELRKMEFNEHINEINDHISERAEKGGYLAPVAGNRTMGNGAAIQKAVMGNDPNIKPIDGYTLVPTHHTDYTGLTEDPTKGYVDEKGNPIKLEARTTWSLYYVPDKDMDTVDMVSGKELKGYYGKFYKGNIIDDNKQYPITYREEIALGSREIESNTRDAKDALAEQREEANEARQTAAVMLEQSKGQMDRIQKEHEGEDVSSNPDYQKAMKTAEDAVELMKSTAAKHNPLLTSMMKKEADQAAADLKARQDALKNNKGGVVDTFANKPLEKPGAQVREEQQSAEDAKNEAMKAAGPINATNPLTVLGAGGMTPEITPKEIPADKAKVYAKAAFPDDPITVAEKKYADLATKNGHTFTNPALVTPPTKGAVATDDVLLKYANANGKDPVKTRQALIKDGWTIK